MGPGKSADPSPREPVSFESRLQRLLPSVLAVIVTIAAIWIVAEKTDFESLSDAFAAADYRILPDFLLVLTAFYVLKAWRWSLLLRPIGRFGVGRLWPSMLAGFAFNNLLPAHLGEFVRMATFSKQSGVSRTAVLSSIALERLFDVLAILAFLSIGLIGVESVDAKLRSAGFVFLVVSVAVTAGAVGYVLATKQVIALVEAVFNALRVPQVLSGKIVRLAELGAAGLGSLRDPRLLAGITLTSVAQWALNGLMIWLALRAFDVTIAPPMAALVLAAVAFGVTIPSTPGYFGVLQAAFVLALASLPSYDADYDRIVAASIFYHVSQWVPVTLIGLIGFRLTGAAFGSLKSEREAGASIDVAHKPVASAADAE